MVNGRGQFEYFYFVRVFHEVMDVLGREINKITRLQLEFSFTRVIHFHPATGNPGVVGTMVCIGEAEVTNFESVTIAVHRFKMGVFGAR